VVLYLRIKFAKPVFFLKVSILANLRLPSGKRKKGPLVSKKSKSMLKKMWKR